MPQATVELGWPAPQVALITVTGPAPNFCTFAQIERLHGCLAEAETAVAWAERIASRAPEALKTLLHEADELPLSEALANEQRRFQACARTPEGLAKIAEVQARYDAGALPADVFDAPFES